MNANTVAFEGPEVKTRHDTVASSAVLASILVSVLCGALLF